MGYLSTNILDQPEPHLTRTSIGYIRPSISRRWNVPAMRSLPFLALLIFISVVCVAKQQTAVSGQSIHRDEQALGILIQAINAAGGESILTKIRDIAGSGSITYYWTDDEVVGDVTIKARGLDQFRLDARLPTGRR